MSKGSSLWTWTTTGFPYILRFIPGFPVQIDPKVVDSASDGEVNLFLYNWAGFVAQSTNSLPNDDQIVFTSTSENSYFIEIRNPVLHQARIVLWFDIEYWKRNENGRGLLDSLWLLSPDSFKISETNRCKIGDQSLRERKIVCEGNKKEKNRKEICE